MPILIAFLLLTLTRAPAEEAAPSAPSDSTRLDTIATPALPPDSARPDTIAQPSSRPRAEDTVDLARVSVVGKSVVNRLREQPFDVAVTNLRGMENNNVTVMEAMDREAGVRVRETGGKGSSYDISLNGLSGRSVRFFLDGVPMDRYGPALGMHALPVNLVDRVEIYKGVVPPQFGSDALGGVVNVVTRNPEGTFADASYAVGSFGLRQATGMAGVNPGKSPWYATASAAHIHTGNDYGVSGPGVVVGNPQTGRAEPYQGPRFHDGYESWALLGETGVRDVRWADRLSVRWIQAGEDKELQNGATMAHVYGEARRNSSTRGPAAQYQKKGFLHKDVSLDLYSSFTLSATTVVDTSSRKYDWSGRVIDIHPENSELGSGAEGKSILTLEDDLQLHQGGLTWAFLPGQDLSLHGTADLTVRRGSDPYGSDRTAGYRKPQKLGKIVTSLSHRYRTAGGFYTQYAWVKNYDFSARATFSGYEQRDSTAWMLHLDPVSANVNRTGFGYAGALNLFGDLIVKLSLERAYRLPDAGELLGDGAFVRMNADLRPERSWNAGLGLVDTRLPLGGKHSLSFELSGFYRFTEDLITYSVQGNQGTGSHINIGKVQGAGGTAEVGYRFAKLFDASANVTYQDLRDARRKVWVDTFLVDNITYKDRLPNIPYLMANASTGLSFQDVFAGSDRLRFTWNSRFVNWFFLYWPSLGSPGTKATIPTQFVSDAGASYSFARERLNVGFDVKNLFDVQVYDNYLLQKPGREYALKVRAFFRSPG
jgi:outer membrane receptor protein involved in Fe transport